jgi:hypothetical protein
MAGNEKKCGGAAFPNPPKRNYQRPRLVAYGRVHSLVAGGIGSVQEGMMMTALMRHP